MWPLTNLDASPLDEDDLSAARALVVDSNPTSRAILVNQLRDFGVGSVSQCTRVVDARRQLEFKTFDIVLCEHHFGRDSATGQELLDDLRRNQLLPFSTVFIMITAEASYAKVAEAAESALDGYLLKPHTASNLGERLYQARQRKISPARHLCRHRGGRFRRRRQAVHGALRQPRPVLAVCRTHRRRTVDAP